MSRGKETIIMTFMPGGKSVIEVKGVSGPGCQALTKKISEALGIVTEDVRTREYIQESETEVRRVQA